MLSNFLAFRSCAGLRRSMRVGSAPCDPADSVVLQSRLPVTGSLEMRYGMIPSGSQRIESKTSTRDRMCSTQSDKLARSIGRKSNRATSQSAS